MSEAWFTHRTLCAQRHWVVGFGTADRSLGGAAFVILIRLQFLSPLVVRSFETDTWLSCERANSSAKSSRHEPPDTGLL